MVTTVSNFNDSRYSTPAGSGFDGVVRLSTAGSYGTGTLLYDGRAILTAAHLIPDVPQPVEVRLQTRSGTQTFTATEVVRHAGYDADANNDLAIVWLSQTAPISANRYGLYRFSDEVGQVFSLSGWGDRGTGLTGGIMDGGPRLQAQNRFDSTGEQLKSFQGASMGWTPTPGSQLIADFDDGTSAHDALGLLVNAPDLGTADMEGLTAPGDSGGPAFISGLLAGVASYGASLSRNGTNPDIDDITNESFGEIAAWGRVSYYQQWIDQNLREHYRNAPTKVEDVATTLQEGGSGTVVTYFLLQFTGVRTNPNEVLSVDYATRDGSAKAGSDYLAVSGKLNLYAGETQAVIPVEVIGDAVSEGDETFYLEVFNPVGGSFGGDRITLTAMRTILNDDGIVG